MYANRTHIGSRFHSHLRRVNDQIWLIDMMANRFDAFLAEHLIRDERAIMSSIMPDYSHAFRLDLPVSAMADVSAERSSMHLPYFLISAYELSNAYTSDVLELCQQEAGKERWDDNGDTAETRIRKNLAQWLEFIEPNVELYILTIHFCRHLRNHFSHQNAKFEDILSKFIAKEGEKLRNGWKPYSRGHIEYEFTADLEAKLLRAPHVVAIIHFLRISVAEIDARIASTIPIDNVIPSCLRGVIVRNPTKMKRSDTLARKLSAEILSRYGITPSKEYLIERVEAFLAEQRTQRLKRA